MTKEELEKEAEEWLSITDNHLNDERTHFLSESEYAEQAYLAGAEPREKRIAELEKENAELKEKIKHRNCLDCSNLSSKLRMRTLELEKECAKVKELLAKLLEEEKNNMYWEMNGSDKSSYYEVRKQAEQFLKECK